MGVIQQYNRIIDLDLITASGRVISLKCPKKGRKPDITISGTFAGPDQVTTIEIQIVNFYYNDLSMDEIQLVKISAGYEGSKKVAIEGSIINIYTSEPGPDSVTNITVAVADVSEWYTRYVANYSIDQGTPVESAIAQLTKKLNYSYGSWNNKVMTGQITSTQKFEASGTVREILQKLPSVYPGITLTINNNNVWIWYTPPGKDSPEVTERNANVYPLKFLTSPPQYTSSSVSVTAMWDPRVRPDDIIELTTARYVLETGARHKDVTKYYFVKTLEFRFSTVKSDNTMTICGVIDNTKEV